MIETVFLMVVVMVVTRRSPADLSWGLFETPQHWLRDRVGSRLCPWVLGLIGIVLATLYVRPALETSGLGDKYAALSLDPFSGDSNAVSHRILTPLISWAVGLRGQAILVTNLVFAAALLGSVASYFQSKRFGPGDSVLATLLLTYSLVTLTTVYFGGYCDALTYLLVFWTWRARERAVVFYVLILLALLNRESVVFLFPWLAYLRVRATGSWWRGGAEALAGLAVALALYLLVARTQSSDPRVQFGLAYYLEPMRHDPWYWIRRSLGFWELGLFSVFRLAWALPVVAAVVAWGQGRRELVYSMAWILAGTSLQMAVAYDSSRMFTLGFMAVIIALDDLLTHSRESLRPWAPALVVANVLVPPVFTAAAVVQVLHSPLMNQLVRNL